MNEVIRVVRMNALDAAIRAGATGESVLPLAKDFFGFLTEDDATPAEDTPKARRRTAAKTTGETENGTASELAPSDKLALVAADEHLATVVEETNEKLKEDRPPAQAEATQEDKDALLKEATMFSQEHGHEALLGALKAVGAERFSAIPFEKYGDFRAAMAAHGIGASALS